MRGRRLRLLYVITLAEVGGAQTYVAQLLPAAAERFDVTVAASGEGPLADAARAAGVDYVPLRRLRRQLSLRDVAALGELVVLFRRLRPDIVHVNSSKAGVLGRLAALLAGVRVRVFTVHGWAFKWHTGTTAKLYLLADRIMRPLTTAFVCVGEAERELGVRAGTCTPRQAVVIPNAVDVTAFRQARLDGSPPVLVSVGRLQAPKDFVTLARALALQEPGSVRTLIAGDGPDRAVVESELPADATVLGERRDVPELLASADLFVLSSRSEGMPISIIEAMAAGLPVVATRVGAVGEVVVDGETGSIVEPGDAAALADAIAALVRDPERRRAYGEAGRRRALERFDLPAFRRAHLELYDRLLP